MAPIKFEENIKETLEKRSITPSSKSWETLSNKLDNHENKKNSNIFWYLGIAASIVGILFIVNGLFFNSTIPEGNDPVIVDIEQVETKNTVETETSESNENLQGEQEGFAVENFQSVPKSNNKLASQKSPTLKAQINQSDKLLSNQSIAKNQKPNVSIINEENSNDIIDSNGLQEEIKTEHIALNTLEETNESVGLDSEIELLLSEAQSQINSDKGIKSVDANSLLQDVEDDLEQSFRDKVFESLKTNFKKVKTAVADRNN